MKRSASATLVTLCLLFAAAAAHAQTSGNAVYGQNNGQGAKAHAEALERAERTLTKEDLPPAGTMFLDAAVLLNMPAEEYVAVFGFSQDAPTVAEAQAKVDAQAKQFIGLLKLLKIPESDIALDLITQPKIYTFDINERIARVRLSGFELKKNIAIHYTSRDLLDRIMAAAAQAQIYDLIKVDYIVKDIPAVQARLRKEAAEIIKGKLAQYGTLLGVKPVMPAEIYAERYATHYPTDLYDAYTAAESETVTHNYNRDNYTIQNARKGRTFYFNGLDANGFDRVINPVLLDPVVQFTLYLKVRYRSGLPPEVSASPTPRP